MVVGAHFEQSNATGINGDQSDNSVTQAGAAYVFEKTANTWAQQAYIKSSNSGGGDEFGLPVVISGEIVAIGAHKEGSDATGVNGDQSNNNGLRTGAVYVFERGNGVWSQAAYLKASDTGPAKDFGYATAISGDLVAVGAFRESSDSGGVYLFDLSVPVANYCGDAVPNSTGSPGVIGMSGSLVVSDNAFSLTAHDLPASVFGYFLSSLGHDFVALPSGSQGTLCLGGGSAVERMRNTVRLSNASGVIVSPLDLSTFPNAAAPVLSGDTWNFQCWYRDVNPGSASNFTDALAVQFE